MISSILYERKLKSQENNYLFSSQYIDFLIVRYLYLKNTATAEDIYNNISKYINSDLIIFSGLKRYLNANYCNKKKLFFLSEKQSNNIIISLNMKREFDFISFISEKKLSLNISDAISTNNFSFNKTLLNMLMLDYKNNKNNSKDYYLSLLYYTTNNYEKLISKIEVSMTKVDDFYCNLPLSDIIDNSLVITLLALNNIITVEDIKNMPSERLLCIFSTDLNELLNLINTISDNYEKVFNDTVNIFYSKLSEHALLVFNNRFNYEQNKKTLTLEEIGNKLNVTRERIRQIEANTIQKLMLQMPVVKNIIKCIYMKLSTENESFIDVDRLFVYLKELQKKNNDMVLKDFSSNFTDVNDTARILLFFMEIGDSNIKYDKNLRVVFDSEKISVDEIVNIVVERFGRILTYKEISKMNSFELKILNSEYREYKNGIYLKHGVSPRELYCEIIDNNFKNGYRAGNQEDYDLFKDKCIKKYGYIEDIPSMHSLQAMIERSAHVLIDKGKYLPLELCPNIDPELLDEIINYIVENKPTVFYRSIYEKYKNDLNKIGIDNHYYLKGCLDKNLPEEFTTKRDYIMIGDIKISPSELIINYMHEFKGEFELRDLKERFPGVKDYVFYNHLYNEVNNGLIWTSSGTFIYFQYLNISEECILELRKFIDEQFNILNTDILSSRKIYAKLSLTNKNLFDKLKLKHGQFTLFSLIKYVFPDLYYSRPLISNKFMEQKSSYSLIKNHVSKYDKFDHSTVITYVSKMNIGGLYSYLEFMDDMSDEYVQINIDTMIRKEVLKISDNQILQLKQLLDLIFEKYKELDTSLFKGYQMLPKMPLSWNKYLLVGVIRSYLDDQFEIENKNNMYNNTDFVIRRLNHEQ